MDDFDPYKHRSDPLALGVLVDLGGEALHHKTECQYHRSGNMFNRGLRTL